MDKRPRSAWAWAVAGLVAPIAGCALVPRSELTDCQKLCRSLQAEASRLKDDALSLRASNRDLAQRAIDDAQHMQALEKANQQLEQSVSIYQDERERQAEALEQIEHEIRSAARASPPTEATARVGAEGG